MIQIEQAIYGDKDGGYGYLNSSFTNLSIPRRLGNSTDVLDKPRSGILKEPTVRMFLKDDYYLVVKSFPQSGEKIREGRVFSHTLFINREDLKEIVDIRKVLSLLMSAITFPDQMERFVLEDGGTQPSNLSQNGRIAFGIKGVVGIPQDENHTIAWVGQNGFWEFVTVVWAGLPWELRMHLRIGSAFDPRKVDANFLSLLTIPETLEPNWAMTQYYLVREDDSSILDDFSEHYIAGNKELAAPLTKVLTEYEIPLREIWHLAILESQLEVYEKLYSEPQLRELVFFADLISKLNPDPTSAVTSKQKLVQQILQLLADADGNGILALRRANWGGLPDAEAQLKIGLEQWCTGIMSGGKASVPELISIVYSEKPQMDWWHECLRDAIHLQLEAWKPSHAKVLWDWVKADQMLVILIDYLGLYGLEVEMDLLNEIPTLNEWTRRMLLECARNYGWMGLHGVLLLQHLPLAEAISAHLKVDKQPGNEFGLRQMAERISPSLWIETCLQLGENRLLKIGSEILVEHPALMEGLDVKEKHWISLWEYANAISQNPWQGVVNPQLVLFQMMEILTEDHAIGSVLLEQLSESNYNDLREYPERKEVWPAIPESARKGFLQGTFLSCLKANELIGLELELQSILENPVALKAILDDPKVSLSKKLGLFSDVPAMNPDLLLHFLEHNRFNSVDSKWMGDLVHTRQWKRVVKWIYARRDERKDLMPALGSCFSLLGTMDRLWCLAKGLSSHGVPQKDWQEAFTEACCDLVPEGPSHNGIWESCGGKNADLKTQTTGRNQWEGALRNLFEGDNQDMLSCLFQELKHEFPYNEKLNMLEKLKRF